jgi:hypothetical protein
MEGIKQVMIPVIQMMTKMKWNRLYYFRKSRLKKWKSGFNNKLLRMLTFKFLLKCKYKDLISLKSTLI